MNALSISDVAAIGFQRPGAAQAPAEARAQLAREFDAQVFRLLWRTASPPGARSGASPPSPYAALGEFFVPQLAAQHSAGFGEMVLRSLDKGA